MIGNKTKWWKRKGVLLFIERDASGRFLQQQEYAATNTGTSAVRVEEAIDNYSLEALVKAREVRAHAIFPSSRRMTWENSYC